MLKDKRSEMEKDRIGIGEVIGEVIGNVKGTKGKKRGKWRN